MHRQDILQANQWYIWKELQQADKQQYWHEFLKNKCGSIITKDIPNQSYDYASTSCKTFSPGLHFSDLFSHFKHKVKAMQHANANSKKQLSSKDLWNSIITTYFQPPKKMKELRLALFGAGGIGAKSALVIRFITGNFTLLYDPTIGVHHYHHHLPEKNRDHVVMVNFAEDTYKTLFTVDNSTVVLGMLH